MFSSHDVMFSLLLWAGEVTAMHHKARIRAIGGTWIATTFAGFCAATGTAAQQLIDLPAEDR